MARALKSRMVREMRVLMKTSEDNGWYFAISFARWYCFPSCFFPHEFKGMRQSFEFFWFFINSKRSKHAGLTFLFCGSWNDAERYEIFASSWIEWKIIMRRSSDASVRGKTFRCEGGNQDRHCEKSYLLAICDRYWRDTDEILNARFKFSVWCEWLS